jgi:hypothetical protein
MKTNLKSLTEFIIIPLILLLSTAPPMLIQSYGQEGLIKSGKILLIQLEDCQENNKNLVKNLATKDNRIEAYKDSVQIKSDSISVLNTKLNSAIHANNRKTTFLIILAVIVVFLGFVIFKLIKK